MPILREQEVSRMPSLQFINAHLSMQKMMVGLLSIFVYLILL